MGDSEEEKVEVNPSLKYIVWFEDGAVEEEE